jgi:hypothetical protein
MTFVMKCYMKFCRGGTDKNRRTMNKCDIIFLAIDQLNAQILIL